MRTRGSPVGGPRFFLVDSTRIGRGAMVIRGVRRSTPGGVVMKSRVSMGFLAALAFATGAQAQAPAKSALPPDINPVTLSRLPPPTAADFDEEGQRLLAARPDFKPGPGPTHVTVYAPRERNLGIPSGTNSPVGARQFQLAALIGARECDQQYEWSAHEPAGLRQGLEQNVIDVVKFNRSVAGLAEKDATFITFGRALFREHRVSSELWAKMVALYGRQHTVELMTIMGDYFRVGIMLNAVDQHLPPDRPALMPDLKR
jgi:4-carboxymuconolactone decarboxylase